MKIPRDTTLLAKGPVRITIREGSLRTRGLELTGGHLVVKAWETFDVLALEDSEAQISGNGQLTPTEGAYPEEWSAFLGGRLIGEARRILVVGETDTGKSTLCTLVANRSLSSGTDVSVIDADVGQSDIGPPTTVGLGMLREPAPRITAAEYVDGYFAGDTSPAFCLMELLEGARLLASRANGLDGLCLVDTCGLVTGPIGLALVSGIIRATEPDLTVLLGRGDELGYVKDLVENWVCLPALPTSRKNLQARRAFRRSQFISCLTGSDPVQLFLSDIRVEGFQARRHSRDSSGGEIPRMRSAGWKLSDLVGMDGAIVGLHRGEEFLGLGLIHSTLFDHDAILISTRVSESPDRLIVGNIRWVDGEETRIFRGRSLEAPA